LGREALGGVFDQVYEEHGKRSGTYVIR
jgi:hypothetical protein